MAADGSATDGTANRWSGRRLLTWLPSVAILAFLAWLIADRWDTLPSDGRLPTVGAAIGATVVHLLANGVLATSWHRQLAMAGQRVPLVPTLRVWATAQLARFLVPGAAFGARAALGRRLGLSLTVGAATTVFEVVWTALVLPVLVLVCVPWWAELPDGWRWIGLGALAPTAVLVALVARPASSVALAARALRRVPLLRSRIPAPNRLSSAELTPARAARLAGMHLLNVAMRTIAFLLLVSSMVSLDGREVVAVIGSSALGMFVGLVAVFAPAGLGPREGMTVLALTPVTGAGIAVVAVAATRLAELVAEAVGWLLLRVLDARMARSAR